MTDSVVRVGAVVPWKFDGYVRVEDAREDDARNDGLEGSLPQKLPKRSGKYSLAPRRHPGAAGWRYGKGWGRDAGGARRRRLSDGGGQATVVHAGDAWFTRRCDATDQHAAAAGAASV